MRTRTRIGIGALVVVAALVVIVVAAASPPGTRWIVRRVLAVANKRLNGSVRVQHVGGSVFGAIALDSVTVRDPNGIPVATITRADIGVSLWHLLAGRIVLRPVVLDQPRVVLIPRPAGGFTVMDLAPPATDSASGGGGGPVVTIQNARIDDGSVVVDSSSATGVLAATEGDGDTRGNARLFPKYAVRAIHAAIPVARLSSGNSREPVVVEIRDAGASLSDPPLTVRDLHGRAVVEGDTIRLAPLEVTTQGSRARVEGWVARDTTPATTAFDLSVVVSRLASDEVRPWSARVPAGLVLEGTFTARAIDPPATQLDVKQLIVTTPSDSGRLSVAGAVVVRPPHAFRIDRPVTVEARRFDPTRLGALVDSVVPPGRITGTLDARGTDDSLGIDLDASMVNEAGQDLLRVRARGPLALSDSDVARFEGVDLQPVLVHLGAARRAGVPTPVNGALEIRGSLTGALRAPHFEGSLVHRGGAGGMSRTEGTLALRSGSPMALTAVLQVDSLDLQELGSAFTHMPLEGRLGGRLEARGRLDSLPFHLRLGGNAGRLALQGLLRRRGDSLEVVRSRLVLDDVDAGRVSPQAPGSRVNAQVRADRLVLAPSVPRGDITIAVDSSSVAGVAIDSGRATMHLDGTSVRLDTLAVSGTGYRVTGAGRVALRPGDTHALDLRADIDSAAILDTLLAQAGDTQAPRPLSGSIQADLHLRGSMDDWTLGGSASVPALDWGSIRATGARLTATWGNRRRAVDADIQVDSLRLAMLSASGLRAGARGALNAWDWNASATVHEAGRWAGGGRLRSDSMGYRTSIDSLRLALGTSSWVADSAGMVVLTGRSRLPTHLALRRADAEGRMAVNGIAPSADSGNLQVVIEHLPIGQVLPLVPGAPSNVRGDLSATLAIDGPAATPRYQLTAGLTGLAVDTASLPAARAEVTYADRRVHGTMTLTDQGRDVLDARGSAPLDLRFPATVRADAGSLAVNLMLDSVPASLVGSLLPAVQNPGGWLDGRLRVGGTWEQPDVRGRLAIRNGAVALPRLGTRYHDIRASLRFAADTAYVDTLGLTDDGGGTASATGHVALADVRNPEFHLDVVGSSFRPINNDRYTDVHTTGRVWLRGSMWSPVLSGNVTLNSGVLHVNDALQHGVVNLEDSLFGQFVDTTVLRRQRLGNPLVERLVDSLRIDSLEVNVGPDVWVRSAAANIQLGGDLVLSKVGHRYQSTGEIRAVRGTYQMALGPAVTREFEVTGGEIRFLGADSLNAVLDINARHTVRTVRGEALVVLVHIGGTLQHPKVTLSSDRQPPIPQTEIISYLMFGAPSVQVFVGSRGREQRSAFQAGAEQLTKLLAGRLEQSFSGLVDYFAITPGKPGEDFSETQILVGKQVDLLGKPSFVTFSPRLCPRQPLAGLKNLGLSLETWLTGQWLLDASLDPRQSCTANTASSATAYQLGVDFLWVLR